MPGSVAQCLLGLETLRRELAQDSDLRHRPLPASPSSLVKVRKPACITVNPFAEYFVIAVIEFPINAAAAARLCHF